MASSFPDSDGKLWYFRKEEIHFHILSRETTSLHPLIASEFMDSSLPNQVSSKSNFESVDSQLSSLALSQSASKSSLIMGDEGKNYLCWTFHRFRISREFKIKANVLLDGSILDESLANYENERISPNKLELYNRRLAHLEKKFSIEEKVILIWHLVCTNGELEYFFYRWNWPNSNFWEK